MDLQDYLVDHPSGPYPTLAERVEKNCFKFFLDLDFKRKIENDDIVAIARYATAALYRMRGTKEAYVKLSSRTEYKTGVHIIFDGLFVNFMEACEICHKTRKYLDECKESDCAFKDATRGLDWKAIIDTKPYRTNLRMVCMAKTVGADDCAVPLAKTFKYSLEDKEKWTVGFEWADEINLSGVEWMKAMSIRAPPEVVKEKADEVPLQLNPTPIKKMFLNLIEGTLKEDYHQSVKITSIFPRKRRGEKVLDEYTLTTSSKFCKIVQRDHKSNHVWFRLNLSEVPNDVTKKPPDDVTKKPDDTMHNSSDIARCSFFCHDEECKESKNGICINITDRTRLRDHFRKIFKVA